MSAEGDTKSVCHWCGYTDNEGLPWKCPKDGATMHHYIIVACSICGQLHYEERESWNHLNKVCIACVPTYIRRKSGDHAKQ